MSTSYLGQVHNKIFDKTSHKQIKIFTVITQKHYVIYKSLNLITY